MPGNASSQLSQAGRAADIPAGLTLLVLVGLVGSGKSTLAQKLETKLGWLRCNQDDMQGDRRLVERKVADGLAEGRNVVVDRTNFDQQQRAHWLRIAAASGRQVRKLCLFLDIPKLVCRDRLATRVGHPTVKTPEMAFEVLDRFSHQLRAPAASEGFDRVLRIDINPALDAASLHAVLERVEREGDVFDPATMVGERQGTLDGFVGRASGQPSAGGSGGGGWRAPSGWAAAGAGNTLGGGGRATG